jgi:hypothetical protein
MTRQILTDSQIHHFIEHGYLILKNAVPREAASEWADRGFARLGYDRRNPATWEKPLIHMPGSMQVNTAEFVPNVWKAACDLLGGTERVKPYFWQDALIWNFAHKGDKPWQPPSAQSGGWHKDGDFFLHFLDSPEQALLSIVCWTDMVHQGGGTFIAPDSVGHVARHLADHPEGVLPTDPAWGSLIHKCKEFIELTGEAGDMVIHHPFMLHASSANVLRVERAITNPPAQLKQPMNFNRVNPADFSPLELGTLRALGVERHDFKPTRPRQEIIPERIRVQRKLREEELARLGRKPVA